jgi:hypothetical protein
MRPSIGPSNGSVARWADASSNGSHPDDPGPRGRDVFMAPLPGPLHLPLLCPLRSHRSAALASETSARRARTRQPRKSTDVSCAAVTMPAAFVVRYASSWPRTRFTAPRSDVRAMTKRWSPARSCVEPRRAIKLPSSISRDEGNDGEQRPAEPAGQPRTWTLSVSLSECAGDFIVKRPHAESHLLCCHINPKCADS